MSRKPATNDVEGLKDKLYRDVNYSMRRYFVDKYFIESMALFNSGEMILDIGGKKVKKRGVFDISKFSLNVKYANIDASSDPDYLCDAAGIPVESGTFDGVILSEVLEHVREPKLVLSESFRVLKSNGRLLVTVPFIFLVHPDPTDYGRYTEYYWREVLQELGYTNIAIVKHGGYYCVLANILKMRLLRLNDEKSLVARIKVKLLMLFLAWFQKKALVWDEKGDFSKTNIGRGHMTGYGISCEKPT